ncbi:MAG TPA: hypothetical protein VHW02_15045 [Rhizomicrobium sp.]|jgi:hypothetical protein|nr:hypothetical protein [Rhizomicrobium sp.]
MKHFLFVTILSLAASPVLADTIVEYGCVVLAKGPSGNVERILPETKVLGPTQSLPKFSIPLPPGYSEASVQCSRSDLVPAENDWKVLRAGYPLFITEKPTGNTIIIELKDGQFHVEFPQASMPAEDDLKQLQARVDQLQTSMQDADFPPTVNK